jgi:ABC-type microcin C transport system permease subunit YejB
MNHTVTVGFLTNVLRTIHILISLAIPALGLAVVFLPKTTTGFWSWHPLKRLLAVIFLLPVIPLCIFIWPFLLLAWLMRPRCNCLNCDDDD